jgi:hypothetical protein
MGDWQFPELISDKNSKWRKVRLEGFYEESQRIALLREHPIFDQTTILILTWFKLEV